MDLRCISVMFTAERISYTSHISILSPLELITELLSVTFKKQKNPVIRRHMMDPFFFLVFLFLEPHLQQMEVARRGVK